MKTARNRKILSVQELTTFFHKKGKNYKVVDALSFDLYPGQTLALVGESGSGKTVTALSILRILPTPPALPPQGKVIYEEKNLLTLSEKHMRTIRGARIAMIFQNPMHALNPVYPIGNQLLEVTSTHLGLEGEIAEKRVINALEQVHISSPLQRMREYPHQMSGGMLQRIMIAMALLCNPDILIADEPTTALDVTIQAQILHLLKELQQQNSMAILLITHDLGVVAELAHEVVVMYATQKVEKAFADNLFNTPLHPYTQALFHSSPHKHVHRGSRKVPMPGGIPLVTDLPRGCYFHPRCPRVMPACKTGKVPSFTGKETSHQVHCWLYDKKRKAPLNEK